MSTAFCDAVLTAVPCKTGGHRFYYRCRQRYSNGPRDCTNTRTLRAETLEEIVWQGVYSLITDQERLKRQWTEYIDRQLRQLERDPDAEMRMLIEKLRKLDQKESYLLDVASDISMPAEKLRTKITELEGTRKELQRALEQTRNRQQSIKELERERQVGHQLLDLVDTHLMCSGSEDRRRIYQALKLHASVDEEYQVRITGIFGPDVYLPTPIQGPPIDPSKPLPKIPEGSRVQVVSPDTTLTAGC